MAERQSFLLRLPPALLDELNRWAKDDLRSVNGQIGYILREQVRPRLRVDMDQDTETRDGET